MDMDILYIKNVINQLEKMVYDQRIRVNKSFLFKYKEKKLLRRLEKELQSRYILLEEYILYETNVK